MEKRSVAADIVGVISNHEDCSSMTDWYGLPFYHLPVTEETKPQQEQQILKVMSSLSVDLLVLFARYMQILSDDLCSQLEGRAINIHHSFLPSFKGARPLSSSLRAWGEGHRRNSTLRHIGPG